MLADRFTKFLSVQKFKRYWRLLRMSWKTSNLQVYRRDLINHLRVSKRDLNNWIRENGLEPGLRKDLTRWLWEEAYRGPRSNSLEACKI